MAEGATTVVDAERHRRRPRRADLQPGRRCPDLGQPERASLSLSPGFEDAGEHSLTVSVSDGLLSDSETITITVTNTNREPTFDQDLGNRSDAEGDVIGLDAGATDADGDTLTYAASGLPAGLSIDTASGQISGTIAFSAAAGSPYTVAITVRDGTTVDATDSFEWTVSNTNRAPIRRPEPGTRPTPRATSSASHAGASDLDGDAP